MPRIQPQPQVQVKFQLQDLYTSETILRNLTIALEHNCYEEFRQLYNENESDVRDAISGCNKENESALLLAAAKVRDLRFINLLFNNMNNPDINVRTASFTSPLGVAMRLQNYDVAGYLIYHGADVNFIDQGRTLIADEILSGRTEGVRFLLGAKGINLNWKERRSNGELRSLLDIAEGTNNEQKSKIISLLQEAVKEATPTRIQVDLANKEATPTRIQVDLANKEATPTQIQVDLANKEATPPQIQVDLADDIESDRTIYTKFKDSLVTFLHDSKETLVDSKVFKLIQPSLVSLHSNVKDVASVVANHLLNATVALKDSMDHYYNSFVLLVKKEQDEENRMWGLENQPQVDQSRVFVDCGMTSGGRLVVGKHTESLQTQPPSYGASRGF